MKKDKEIELLMFKKGQKWRKNKGGCFSTQPLEGYHY